MEKKVKISPFQLTMLLVLSRMFTVISYSPADSPLPHGTVSIFTTLISAVVQYVFLILAAFWCTGDQGVSPIFLTGYGAKTGHFIFGGLYWGFSLLICLYTVLHFTYFLSLSFYDFQKAWPIALIFVFCIGIAVSQGLEAFARGSAIFALVIALGIGCIALGLWREYDFLNWVRTPWNIMDTAWGVYQGFAANFELVALLLLLPYTNLENLRPRMAAGWLGIATILSVGMILITTFSLGEYAGVKIFPVFAAASSAKVLLFQHLDAVFMAIWVLLAFVKGVVFLFLAASMWGELCRREMTGTIVWANAGLVIILALLSLHWENLSKGIYWVSGSGIATVVAVLLLPLAGWILRANNRKGGNRS